MDLEHLQKVAVPRIVVVGGGPVGMRFVNEIAQRLPKIHVHIFSNEPYEPYNRVQLSALLAGDVSREKINLALPEPQANQDINFTIARIIGIDTVNKTVTDANNQVYSYDCLVLATGARAHVPQVPGVKQTGVYTFRNLKDTEFLKTRVVRARSCVVVGGGLLGLETAKGLLRFNTQVTLVQQGDHLMNRQLDESAASLLQDKVESLGIKVIVNSGVREIFGDGRVSSVRTYAGETLECDTVVLCAGITPNVELARESGIHVAKGIVVSDQLQTSDDSVFAIGECCEHKSKTYGVVTPGFEQAAVLADVLQYKLTQASLIATDNAISNTSDNTPQTASYQGSVAISRLKVVGESVCSIGEVVELPDRPFQEEWTYKDSKNQIYRKIVLLKGRIIGAVGFGDWPEVNRIQEAFKSQRTFALWQKLNFKLNGRLWFTSNNESVLAWPEDAIVCQCNNIKQGTLCAAVASGCQSLDALQSVTTAGTVCGSCKPLLSELVGSQERVKERAWIPTLVSSFLTIVITLLVLFIPGLSVSDSVQTTPFFETIWNDKFFKQVTGFSLLGLTLIGLLMSLRKRIPAIKNWGQFSNWRLLHIILGVLCAFVLICHTGFHLGSNLNQMLMINFLGVLLIGALTGGVIALSHKLNQSASSRVRRFWTWVHIFVTWPLPVLLGVHILTVYYY